MEAPVLEVILDAGAADPAGPAVHDHDLAMVDVAQTGQVPTGRTAASQRPERSTELRRPDDADLDTGGPSRS